MTAPLSLLLLKQFISIAYKCMHKILSLYTILNCNILHTILLFDTILSHSPTTFYLLTSYVQRRKKKSTDDITMVYQKIIN